MNKQRLTTREIADDVLRVGFGLVMVVFFSWSVLGVFGFGVFWP